MALSDEDKEHILDLARTLMLEPVLALIEADPHTWSSRPCSTCSAVSQIVGRPFGCSAKAKVIQKRNVEEMDHHDRYHKGW